MWPGVRGTGISARTALCAGGEHARVRVGSASSNLLVCGAAIDSWLSSKSSTERSCFQEKKTSYIRCPE